jgi:hypothetical protein
MLDRPSVAVLEEWPANRKLNQKDLPSGTFQRDAQKVKCPWEGHFILSAPTYAALARAAE